MKILLKDLIEELQDIYDQYKLDDDDFEPSERYIEVEVYNKDEDQIYIFTIDKDFIKSDDTLCFEISKSNTRD